MSSRAEPGSVTTRTDADASAVDLAIGGMTCASCAARIEKKLNRLDGVTATVNYATEKAAVSYADGVTTDDLIATVEKTGYTAAVPAPEPETPTDDDEAVRALRRRVLISTALSIPVVALAVIPALQFATWEWVALALAGPVVVWGGWPFHLAAWTNLRHGAATMDTLVSLGTLAAFGCSLYALVAGRGDTYLEAAAVVRTFVLAGRYLEARSKRRAGAALRALLE